MKAAMAKLYFCYAAMNAGKSTLLLQASHNYVERGMRTLLFTSALYAEDGIGVISSRLGISAEAELYAEGEDLFSASRTSSTPAKSIVSSSTRRSSSPPSRSGSSPAWRTGCACR
jgi:thymidine kinase